MNWTSYAGVTPAVPTSWFRSRGWRVVEPRAVSADPEVLARLLEEPMA